MATQQGTDTTGRSEREIERSVLAYLECHPQAADTLRGIANWWLPRQRGAPGCRRIGHVLDRLVAEGVLHRDELPDGEVLYALIQPAKPPH